ncbi:MAG: cyclic nucleotide-binding domain-containing protein [Chitinispirillaceae bacterium]|nr:cyclic nucleotide-binding domain-containing protein [Chitinispirillaceae bacterium]
MSLKGRSDNKVGAGKSIVNRHERFFHRGTLMFIEGESSTEMFIIRSGCVRVLKQEGENTVELARLGPGSVLGELSLLDHRPRSATAQVLEDTTVTVIDEELFARTLQSIPDWLGNMIRLVVKRLRDTMKKNGEDMVNKSIGGVLQIILLMTEAKTPNDPAKKEALVSAVKDQMFALIGLGGLELENIFLHLILKNLLLIRKNEQGREFILIKDRPALRLYLQYLRMHQRGGTLIGESFTEGTFDLIEVLLEAGKRNGSGAPDKLMRIEEHRVEIELARRGGDRFIDRDALDQLTESKLLALQEDRTVSKHGHHGKRTLLFNPEILQNVVALKTWLPVFREEIKF